VGERRWWVGREKRIGVESIEAMVLRVLERLGWIIFVLCYCRSRFIHRS
jgi:hypothetical protein